MNCNLNFKIPSRINAIILVFSFFLIHSCSNDVREKGKAVLTIAELRSQNSILDGEVITVKGFLIRSSGGGNYCVLVESAGTPEQEGLYLNYLPFQIAVWNSDDEVFSVEATVSGKYKADEKDNSLGVLMPSTIKLEDFNPMEW